MKRVNFNNKYLNRGYMKLKMRLMIYVGLGGGVVEERGR